MARRKLSERNIRKLTRMGAGWSLGLTLPVEMIRKLKWRERQKVVVKLRGKNLIIKDWKKK
jgi:antitoxin component of MazEF toxin-antitoxin module